MKRMNLLLGVFLIVSMLLSACGAEETGTSVPETNVPPTTSESTMTEEGTVIAETPVDDGTTTPSVPVTGEDSASRLSNLLDYDVWNQNSEQVGEVEDMVLDMDANHIAYVVIEMGGFLDIGDKTVLIPWNTLELQTQATGAQENTFVLMADAEMLNNAPDVDLDAVLPAIAESAEDWDADIRSFWESGVVPEATQPADATETPAAEQTAAAPEMTATTTIDSTTGTGQHEQLQGVLLASDLLGTTITIGNAGGEGIGQGQATAIPAATTAPNATVMPDSTATAETGRGLDTGNQGLTEATIEDAILDPATGDILYLVLNSLFDDGERWIPVPLSTLRWDMTNESFLFVANANALQNAPFFEPDLFPDTTTEGWDADFNDFWADNTVGP